MSKRKRPGLLSLFLCCCLLFGIDVIGQVSTAGDNLALTVASTVLIGTNSPTISMSLQPVTAAGAKLSSVSNSSLYIKISSVVPSGTARKVTVKLLSGTIPAGTQITLQPASCTTTNSAGALGTVVSSPVVVSSVDQNLITNIGTCYTGTGSSDGYNMTFNWGIVNPSTAYGQVVSSTYNPIVVFTITAPE